LFLFICYFLNKKLKKSSFTGLWENCNQVKGVNTWFDGRSYDGEYHAGQKQGQVCTVIVSLRECNAHTTLHDTRH